VRYQIISTMVRDFPNQVGIAYTPEDFRRLNGEGKFAVFISMLNAYPLGHDLSQLDLWAKRGMRMFGFSYTGNNDWADSSRPLPFFNDTADALGGLSPLGEQAVKRLNQLGVIIDVSQMSTLGQGVGLAFLIQTPRPDLPARFEGDAVYLDRIQDPGNVGTLLRTTAAAGIATVITAPGTAWCWSPKVLRAGMGAHFHLAIHESVSWETVRDRLDALVIGTRLQQASSVFESDLRGASVWLFGSEGEGVSSVIAPDVSRWLRIPQMDSVESLNVAAAAAICLFEQRRQRSLK
jgi:tRNA(Leu) C34 or U34 (ribose-2'-O)-methylase TrmL